MSFTKNEKLAVAKALAEVAMVDGKIANGEAMYMVQLEQLTGINEKTYERGMAMSHTDAVYYLSNMTRENKEILIVMLTEMAKSDGYFSIPEKELMHGIFESAGIRFA